MSDNITILFIFQLQVLVLRELALSSPTFFFQQVQTFFDVVFCAVRDPKPIIREGAVTSLRAALVVTSQRETKEAQRATWYKQCYDEAQKGFEDSLAKDKGLTKDDRTHGSLLVLQELLRCSNAEGERILAELEQLNLLHSQTIQVNFLVSRFVINVIFFLWTTGLFGLYLIPSFA